VPGPCQRFGAAVLILALGGCGPRSKDVQWRAGNDTIAATLTVPKGEGPFPAVVFVPGSGSLGRESPMPRAHARRLARDGIGVAFVILVSSTPLTPLRQSLFATEQELRARRLSDRDLDAALRLQERIFDVYVADSGWRTTQRAIDAARSEPWFDPDLFGLQPDTSWNWRWLHGLPFDFDVTPLLRELEVPPLTVNGSADPLVPADSSRALFATIATTPNRRSVVLSGNHHLGAGDRREPSEEYWEVVESWLAMTLRAGARP
jgi:dienelactone hydrolase